MFYLLKGDFFFSAVKDPFRDAELGVYVVRVWGKLYMLESMQLTACEISGSKSSAEPKT